MKIKEILEANFEVEIDDLNISLLEVPNFDSLNFIELLVVFDGLGLKIELEEIVNAKALKDLDVLINERI